MLVLIIMHLIFPTLDTATWASSILGSMHGLESTLRDLTVTPTPPIN